MTTRNKTYHILARNTLLLVVKSSCSLKSVSVYLYISEMLGQCWRNNITDEGLCRYTVETC